MDARLRHGNSFTTLEQSSMRACLSRMILFPIIIFICRLAESIILLPERKKKKINFQPPINTVVDEAIQAKKEKTIYDLNIWGCSEI
jgi:hypothetical protein